MTTLTRRYRFSASHRLCASGLGDERNREIFGKCANPYGHGHNYYLEVSVEGEPDPVTGMLVRRDAMDRWVRETVLDRLDHRHLNAELAEFRTLVPTSENVLIVAEAWLRESWSEHFSGRATRLSALRLEETPRNSFRVAPREQESIS